jgi:putative Mg2+ transporter-C (MgtC) family protein
MTLQGWSILEGALRLALALVLALPIAWERDRRSRSAGLRSYPLVSACVCGFLLLAQGRAGGPGALAVVFYGVVPGRGFFGSGAVFKSTERARGMGTAVSRWVAGAIGAGVAYELPLLSAAIALMSLLALAAPAVARRLDTRRAP